MANISLNEISFKYGGRIGKKREPYNMKSYKTDIPDRVADHGIALT